MSTTTTPTKDSTSVAIQIGPTDNGRAMTLQEFLDAEVVEGYRYELARGVLEVTEVPNEPHGDIEWFLGRLLALYDLSRPGFIRRVAMGGSTRLWLPGMVSGRNPDIAVILQNAPRDYRSRRIPVLAIEIVSPGRLARERDYVTKREEYLAYGLLEYWIVDPIETRVTVLTRQGDLWAERIFQGDQTAEGVALPGLMVHLPELWAAAEDDRLATEEQDD